jgi:hypothetical protein
VGDGLVGFLRAPGKTWLLDEDLGMVPAALPVLNSYPVLATDRARDERPAGDEHAVRERDLEPWKPLAKAGDLLA